MWALYVITMRSLFFLRIRHLDLSGFWARIVCNNIHQTYTCYDEIEKCVQNTNTILGSIIIIIIIGLKWPTRSLGEENNSHDQIRSPSYRSVFGLGSYW